MITVKVFATYRKLADNRKELTLDHPTPLSVERALEAVFEAYPALRDEILDAQGDILPHVSVFASGRDVRHKQGLETELQEGETLSLFPPVAGG